MLLLSLKNDWQPLLFESGRCENSFVDYKINYEKLCYSLRKIWTDPVPSFKLWISLGFVTSCYVIFSLPMVQAMDILMITQQNVTKPREIHTLKMDSISVKQKLTDCKQTTLTLLPSNCLLFIAGTSMMF